MWKEKREMVTSEVWAKSSEPGGEKELPLK